MRQVDPNWYEAELNGKAGLVPSSYMEVSLLDSMIPGSQIKHVTNVMG